MEMIVENKKIKEGIYGLYLKEELYIDDLFKNAEVFLEEKVDRYYFQNHPTTIGHITMDEFYTNLVESEIKFYKRVHKYEDLFFEKTKNELLKVFKLENKGKISNLSSSEKVKLKIICHLIFHPKVLVFNHVLSYLDKKTVKELKTYLLKKKIIVIFYENDLNLLFSFCDKFIFYENNLIITSKSNLNEEEYLPDILKITKLARLKKINLSYWDDVRDIIKDIYKHV